MADKDLWLIRGWSSVESLMTFSLSFYDKIPEEINAGFYKVEGQPVLDTGSVLHVCLNSFYFWAPNETHWIRFFYLPYFLLLPCRCAGHYKTSFHCQSLYA